MQTLMECMSISQPGLDQGWDQNQTKTGPSPISGLDSIGLENRVKTRRTIQIMIGYMVQKM